MPIVTLSTDIGQTDFIVGAIKGQLLQAAPAVRIVDISHCLSSQNYLQAAYICSNAFKHFPKETFHIVIVNLFDVMPHHLLITQYKEQFIACPDNGILTMITGSKPDDMIAIDIEHKEYLGVLHCTQSIVNAFYELVNGKSFNKLGRKIVDIEEKYPMRSTAGADWIDSQIIFIDNFENVVVNLTHDEFEEHRKGRNFKIIFTRDEDITVFSKNYASVGRGEVLAWFNSANYLEIAVNQGNLAGLFGLTGFSENQHTALQQRLMFQTRVRIIFENL
ncbi:MAG: SAM-dependent chlorinase/fluorinase [Parafilimonas sp.]